MRAISQIHFAVVELLFVSAARRFAASPMPDVASQRPPCRVLAGLLMLLFFIHMKMPTWDSGKVRKFSALSIVFYFSQDRLCAPPGKQLNHSPAGVWLKPHCFEIELITQDLSCVAYCKIGSL